MDPYTKALSRIKLNTVTELAPIEGRYTQKGLEEANRRVEVQEHDYNIMHGLIAAGAGLAGSSPVQMGV